MHPIDPVRLSDYLRREVALMQRVHDPKALLKERIGTQEFEGLMASRVNVCWGLAEGNSGVTGTMRLTERVTADDQGGSHPDGGQLARVLGDGHRGNPFVAGRRQRSRHGCYRVALPGQLLGTGRLAQRVQQGVQLREGNRSARLLARWSCGCC